MVMTIEPGVYVSADDKSVAKRWRGIGIRIEDDVQVTRDGPDVLTGGLPTTVAEIERHMGARVTDGGAATATCSSSAAAPSARRSPARSRSCRSTSCSSRRTTSAARAAELRPARHGARERLAEDSRGLGLWPELKGHTEAIRSIHISERGRFGAARIDAEEEGVAALGYTVENQALGRVLWERSRARRACACSRPRSVTELAAGPTSHRGQIERGGRARACAARGRRGRRALVRCARARRRGERARLRAARRRSSTAAPRRRSPAARSSVSRRAARSRCCRSRAGAPP